MALFPALTPLFPAEARKKESGKSEVSQEDTASEAEAAAEEPLNGDEEEGLAREECEDELVRELGIASLQQRSPVLGHSVTGTWQIPRKSRFSFLQRNCCV